jgi:hypothetical protein
MMAETMGKLSVASCQWSVVGREALQKGSFQSKIEPRGVFKKSKTHLAILNTDDRQLITSNFLWH